MLFSCLRRSFKSPSSCLGRYFDGSIRMLIGAKSNHRKFVVSVANCLKVAKGRGKFKFEGSDSNIILIPRLINLRNIFNRADSRLKFSFHLRLKPRRFLHQSVFGAQAELDGNFEIEYPISMQLDQYVKKYKLIPQ